MITQKDKKMGWFGPKFIYLTDENVNPTAFGRTLIINRDSVVAVFRREEDPTKSNVLTVDGKTYIVKESVQAIGAMLK